MKPLYRNIFLVVGLASLLMMIANLNLTLHDVLSLVRRAGVWLPACILLWLFIYVMNAWTWGLIIREGGADTGGLGFWRVFKYTVTGYALNYVTPAGVLGGEPYRIMELKPFLGTERAVSSVLLNSMMHIFSHFCFWAFCIVLFFCCHARGMNMSAGVLLVLSSLFVCAGLYVFYLAYRHGMAEKSMAWMARMPVVGGRLARWTHQHRDTLQTIDSQITALHRQSPRVFFAALALEFGARVLGCLELQFILFIFTDRVALADCILMQGFSSLIANLVFFIPMQLGVREASMALFTGFSLANGSYGVLTGLLIRIREMVWIAIGMCLLKAGNVRAVLASQNKS